MIISVVFTIIIIVIIILIIVQSIIAVRTLVACDLFQLCYLFNCSTTVCVTNTLDIFANTVRLFNFYFAFSPSVNYYIRIIVCSLLFSITNACSYCFVSIVIFTAPIHVFISSCFVVSCSLNSLNSALLSSSLFFCICSLVFANSALNSSLDPVSYTHLDVYKRQIQHMAVSLHYSSA